MTVDELRDYGIQRMDDEAIENFLSIQHAGILGLPTSGAPYLLPMSYGFDGGSHLYFAFLVEGQSRKAELADQADVGSFLVYNAETMFHWRSVLLRGPIRRLSEEERSKITEAQTPAWQPELIETASETCETRVYEFQIEESTGVSHAIRPPTFFERESRDATE